MAYPETSTPHFLRVAITVVIGLGLVVCWLTILALELITMALTYGWMNKYTRTVLLGRIFRGTHALFCVYFNPLWRVKYIGKPVPDFGGAIVMANHLSNVDPFVVCSQLFPHETKYIAKSSLFTVPLGGWAMGLAGDIPIYFTSAKGGWGTKKGSIGKMMAHCKDLLAHGVSIAVYPEGIRSKTGVMGPFKDGMFMLAEETGVDIVPCAISGSGKLWPYGDWRLDQGVVYFGVGDPISSKGKSVEQLKKEVRDEIIRVKSTFPETFEPEVAPDEIEQKDNSEAAPTKIKSS